MKQPLVSIIIPVYNTGQAAAGLIGLILNDRYENIEVIAIDDGSSDDSLKLLRKIKDSRVKILHQKNQGASAARNAGLKVISGEYVLFVDSDDSIAPEFISAMVSEIRRKDVAVVSCGYRYRRLQKKSAHNIYEQPSPAMRNGESRKEYVLRSLLRDGRLYPVTNKIFKAGPIVENKVRFALGMDFAEDTKFVLDYLAVTPGEIRHLTTPLYYYNYGTETSIVSKSSMDWKNWQKSYDDLVAWVGAEPSRVEKRLLRLILRRWKISHALAVARSRAPFSVKKKYLNPMWLPLAGLVAKVRK